MSQDLGYNSLFYEELGPQGSSSSHDPVDIVLVNGPSEHRRYDAQWRSTDDVVWPRAWLQHYGGRLLVFQDPVEDTDWDTFLKRGDELHALLKKFWVNSTNWPVALCNGLGGLLFLEALSKLRGSADRTPSPLAMIFLGTPLNAIDTSKFHKSVERCWRLESKAGYSKLSSSRTKELHRLLEQLDKPDGSTIAVYEKRETKILHRMHLSSSHVVVNRALASPFKGAYKVLEFDADHLSLRKPTPQMCAELRGELDGVFSGTRSRLASASVGAPSAPSGQGRTAYTNMKDATGARDSQPAGALKGKPRVLSQFQSSSYFIGRLDVFKMIDEHLLPRKHVNTRGKAETTRTAGFAICGEAGVGKTQTAVEYLWSRKDMFSLCLLVMADTEQKLLSDLEQHARALGLIDESVSDATAGAREVRRKLEESTEPWLLVLDNVEERAVMNNYWIRSDVGSILVTARHINFAKPTMAGAGCKLAPLERSEAVELLKAQTADQNKGDTGEGWGDSEALTIVERAGYLPLTIQLSVGLVNYHDCTWAEFNKWWPRPRDVLKDGSGLVDNPDSKYGKNAQDVYVHLLSKLDEDSTSVVRIFSLLDPTTIREEWACTGWLAEKVKNGAKIVSGLKSRFILNPKSHAGGGGPRSVTMHRYVSDMVQAMMDPADKQAAFEGAVWVISSSLTHIWKSNMERIKQEFMDSVPHVLALNIFFKENKSNLGLRVPFEFIPMLSCAAAICYRRNAFASGLSLLEVAEATLSTRSEFRIAASEQDLLRAEIDCCYHRACIFTEMGSFDSSIRYFQRGWDLVQRLGSSSPDPGSPHPWSVDQMRYGLCGGIANSLNGLGKNLESLEKYNECLALKPNDNSTIYEVNRCRCQLAIGMLDEAHAGLVSFIKKRREEEDAMKSGGMSHHSFMTGSAYYILGNVLVAKGSLDEAYDYHSQALQSWKETYGNDHHKTGDAYHKMGWHLERLGKDGEALKFYEGALRIYYLEGDVRYRKPEIARTSFCMSRLLRRLGREDEARERLATAEVIVELFLGRPHEAPLSEECIERYVSPWVL